MEEAAAGREDAGRGTVERDRGAYSPAAGLHPNTTQIPDVILDDMSSYSDTELRVMLAVIRATWGWQKSRDWLTGSQIQQRTGRHHTAVSGAIGTLVDRGLLVVHDKDGTVLETPSARKRVGERHSRLYFSPNPNIDRPVRKVDRPFPESGQAPIQKVDTTTPKQDNTQSLQQGPVSAAADAPPIFCDGAAYSAAFEEVWGIWLGLGRGENKQGAAKAWNTTVRTKMNGSRPEVAAATLLKAARNFGEAMRHEERAANVVMHCATFFGQFQRWRDYEDWTPPEPGSRRKSGASELQKARVDAEDMAEFDRALAERQAKRREELGIGVAVAGGGP